MGQSFDWLCRLSPEECKRAMDFTFTKLNAGHKAERTQEVLSMRWLAILCKSSVQPNPDKQERSVMP